MNGMQDAFTVAGPGVGIFGGWITLIDFGRVFRVSWGCLWRVGRSFESLEVLGLTYRPGMVS
jgi:hypothetical protein